MSLCPRITGPPHRSIASCSLDDIEKWHHLVAPRVLRWAPPQLVGSYINVVHSVTMHVDSSFGTGLQRDVGQFSISAHLYDYSACAEPRGSVSITTEHASLSAAAAAPSHGSLRSRLHVIKTFKTEQGNRRHQTPPPNHRCQLEYTPRRQIRPAT